jgi:hypothetical protein
VLLLLLLLLLQALLVDVWREVVLQLLLLLPLAMVVGAEVA